MTSRSLALIVTLVGLFGATPSQAQTSRAAWMEDPETTGIREVTASRNVIPLTTKLRYTTLILLPDGEEVMDILCGDKDLWVISATHNIVHVKPTTAGKDTNLNLVTASGAVYSFLLREGRPDGKPVTPDLKVYVTSDAATPPHPKWIPVAQYEAVQAELVEVKGKLEEAKSGLEAERTRAAEQAASGKRAQPTDLICDYGTVPNTKPFFVQSICRTDSFTYIRSGARELPALYEVKDGEPSILQFQVENGTYVVPKVLEKAYLAIGKERLPFTLRGN